MPRPAICVETVIRPALPASEMIAASSVAFRALSRTQSSPTARSSPAIRSDSRTLWVATSTGLPSPLASPTRAATAASRWSEVA